MDPTTAWEHPGFASSSSNVLAALDSVDGTLKDLVQVDAATGDTILRAFKAGAIRAASAVTLMSTLGLEGIATLRGLNNYLAFQPAAARIGYLQQGADEVLLAMDGANKIRLFAPAGGITLQGGVAVSEVANAHLRVVSGGTTNLSRIIAADATADDGYLDYDHSSRSWVIRAAGTAEVTISSAAVTLGGVTALKTNLIEQVDGSLGGGVRAKSSIFPNADNAQYLGGTVADSIVAADRRWAGIYAVEARFAGKTLTGGTTASASVGAGDIQIPFNRYLWSRNEGGTDSVFVIGMSTGNYVRINCGTAGASTPGAFTADRWMPIRVADNTLVYVPCRLNSW